MSQARCDQDRCLLSPGAQLRTGCPQPLSDRRSKGLEQPFENSKAWQWRQIGRGWPASPALGTPTPSPAKFENYACANLFPVDFEIESARP